MSAEQKIIVTGDLNFMGLGQAKKVFDRIKPELQAADVVISNLECCFYDDKLAEQNQSETGHFYPRSGQREGFYAEPGAVSALKTANVSIVGNANNCNYGDAAIRSTIDVLQNQKIPFSGAGRDWKQACEPAFFHTKDLKIGFIQRTSVYWPNNHEASMHNPGVATLKIHTAYSPQLDGYAANRPGTPPDIYTWVDRIYLDDLVHQIRQLKETNDIVIASFHWGYREEILDYMRETARAAIDAGADIIFGHGPHVPLPIEIYRSKPIFFGLGSFVFHNGHRGKTHGHWLGMMGRIDIQNKQVKSFGFSLVRRDKKNQTYICDPTNEMGALEPIFSAMRSCGIDFFIRSQTVDIKTPKCG